MNPALLGIVLIPIVAIAGVVLSSGEQRREQVTREQFDETKRVFGLELVHLATALHQWALVPANRGRVGEVPRDEMRLVQAAGEQYTVVGGWRLFFGPVTWEGRSGWAAVVVCDSACVDGLQALGLGRGEVVNAALDNSSGAPGIGWAKVDGFIHNPRLRKTTVVLPATALAIIPAGSVPLPAAGVLMVDPAKEAPAWKADVGGLTEMCYLTDPPPPCPDIDGRCLLMKAEPGFASIASDGSLGCPTPDPQCPPEKPFGTGKVFTRNALWRNSVEAPNVRRWAYSPWYVFKDDCQGLTCFDPVDEQFHPAVLDGSGGLSSDGDAVQPGGTSSSSRDFGVWLYLPFWDNLFILKNHPILPSSSIPAGALMKTPGNSEASVAICRVVHNESSQADASAAGDGDGGADGGGE
jgi:hypothetical protein